MEFKDIIEEKGLLLKFLYWFIYKPKLYSIIG